MLLCLYYVNRPCCTQISTAIVFGWLQSCHPGRLGVCPSWLCVLFTDLWSGELARAAGCRRVVVSVRLRGVSEGVLHHQGLQGRGLEVSNRRVRIGTTGAQRWEAVHHLRRGRRGQHSLSVNHGTWLTPPRSRGGSSWHNICPFSHKKSKVIHKYVQQLTWLPNVKLGHEFVAHFFGVFTHAWWSISNVSHGERFQYHI